MRHARRVRFSAESRLAPPARVVAEARSYSGTPCLPGTQPAREAGPSAESRCVLAVRFVAATQPDPEAQSVPKVRSVPEARSSPWTQLARAARSAEETGPERPGHHRAVACHAERLRVDHHRCRHSAGHPSGRTKGWPSTRDTLSVRPFAYGRMPLDVSPKGSPQRRCHEARQDFLCIRMDRGDCATRPRPRKSPVVLAFCGNTLPPGRR